MNFNGSLGLTFIFLLSFLAVFMVSVAVLSIPLSSRTKVKHSLNHLAAYEISEQADTQLESDFFERIIRPMLNKISGFTKSGTNSERIAKTQNKLTLAGIRNLTADQFITLKYAFGAFGIIAYLLFIGPVFHSFWLGLLVVGICYFLPDFWLNQKIKNRQKQIGASLADAIDILTVAVEAGLAFDSALSKVSRNMDGPLSEELGRMLGEMQIGISRGDALRNLSNRTNLSDLQNFCTTLIQADTLGISIGKILKEEVNELRTRRRQEAEEQALKMPVKLVFPVVLCILPALMIVILGPAIIKISGSLF